MSSTSNWRYVEDDRDYTWPAMVPANTTFSGATSGNAISSCGAATTGACASLPGALLVSSAGGIGPVSAVEWIAPMNRVVQLQLGVRIPDGGASQVVRLYRSSREDALFSATADPGVTIDNTLTLDVVQGDRIFVTLEGDAVTDVAVQLFVVGDMASFPSTCSAAVAFDTMGSANGTVTNACGGVYTLTRYSDSLPVAVTLVSGPFDDAGKAGRIAFGNYFASDGQLLNQSGDFTVQFWMNFHGITNLGDQPFAFSDLDGNSDDGGGLGLYLYDGMNGTALSVQTVTSPHSSSSEVVGADYNSARPWHFIRASYARASNLVTLCIDGTKKGSQIAPNTLKTTITPALGFSATIGTVGAFFDGDIDQFRAVTQALPCN